MVTTDKLNKLIMYKGPATTVALAEARIQIEFTEALGITAMLGGYRGWREYLAAAFFRWLDDKNTISSNHPPRSMPRGDLTMVSTMFRKGNSETSRRAMKWKERVSPEQENRL